MRHLPEPLKAALGVALGGIVIVTVLMGASAHFERAIVIGIVVTPIADGERSDER